MDNLLKRYEAILKAVGLGEEPKKTQENGEIKFAGKRWIMMNVDAFPSYMIKSTANIMGERMAQEFLYWFGYTYGEKTLETYQNLGVPTEQIPEVVAAFTAFFTGWGIPEILEFSPERGRLLVKLHNDFESASAIMNNEKPTNNFMRGVLAGMFAKALNTKVRATSEYKDGVTFITVEKR
ncbi:MAG: XylR N-terminal domain-containing protein [Candidatus Atribacteria bacterium]|nr:XylR N-terminal domain-containing protein [Candidatus Atribacteria bacterium]